MRQRRWLELLKEYDSVDLYRFQLSADSTALTVYAKQKLCRDSSNLLQNLGITAFCEVKMTSDQFLGFNSTSAGLPVRYGYRLSIYDYS
ncbi:hypothetical protein L6452_13945 [Arctium lappa]|uniref:Uncharacterized protein n=1 Tax=Arctium lappa TaxID=4217 RepID=A0ACB9CJP4_ARCLA|nr:hypothetical protein L6452_13945 [Arctium lappa]